jgi:hypothetical protein
MQQTRKIEIANRVFTISDLMRFAKILDGQSSAEPDLRFSTTYEVAFEDELSIEGRAVEVFTQEELNRQSRPVTVEMRLRCQGADRYIRLNLRAGNQSYGNAIIIGSDDAGWLNANFTALNFALEKATPQTLWWRRHPTLLLNLIALGAGFIYNFLVEYSTLALIYSRPGLASYLHSLPTPAWLEPIGGISGYGPSGWVWRWLTGFIFAYWIRLWILSMWPSVEFNFGSPYLRPDNRRQKLNAIMTLLVLPIIAAAIYDVVKALAK